MDFVGERYYKLNRILLLSLGLWPYQVSTLKKTQIIFFQTLFISFLVCQCNTFLVKQLSSNYIAKIFMFIIINCIYIIKYNACLLLSDNIKYIFDRVRYDWNMLKAQAELEVMRRYADNAKLYTICFTCLVISNILGLLIIICLPLILDVIVPMNESRPRQLPINVEYFVDEETYFFPILTHIVLNQYAGSMTVVAIATILIAYVLHASAMFKIASHRIEHIFENVQLMPKDIKQHILYNKLIHAVYVHRRAVDLANILTNSFATLYFVLIGFGVASTSLSFFNFINAVISLEKVDILVCCGVIFVHLYYLFVGNYVGQNIIDDSTGIHQATYNAQWYAAPLCMQKFILLIMQRSNRKSSLTAGGLFDASLEGFSKLISMSVSYVMVLQSMGIHKESHEKDNSRV
ncbi:odorant receptor 9a-like [Temnothorax nylanderi]|uniref:odorant receptor 9a-like n=1 Tax=Temnothorax nylanderi TaxID=102681 RepID=UPI003A8A8055